MCPAHYVWPRLCKLFVQSSRQCGGVSKEMTAKGHLSGWWLGTRCPCDAHSAPSPCRDG